MRRYLVPVPRDSGALVEGQGCTGSGEKTPPAADVLATTAGVAQHHQQDGSHCEPHQLDTSHGPRPQLAGNIEQDALMMLNYISGYKEFRWVVVGAEQGAEIHSHLCRRSMPCWVGARCQPRGVDRRAITCSANGLILPAALSACSCASTRGIDKRQLLAPAQIVRL
jgi:hypothetical protein